VPQRDVIQLSKLQFDSTRRRQTMEQQFDGTVNAGRKGVAYDWQSLLAAVEATSLDTELAGLSLTSLYAE